MVSYDLLLKKFMGIFSWACPYLTADGLANLSKRTVRYGLGKMLNHANAHKHRTIQNRNKPMWIENPQY